MRHWKVVGAAATVLVLFLLVAVFRGGWLPTRESPHGLVQKAAVPDAVVAAPHAGDGAAVPRPPVRAEETSSNTLPAWMTGAVPAPPEGGVPPRPAAAAAGAQAERTARLQSAMQNLQRLQAKGANVDALEVEQALGELERANGSSVLQGIRLDVLRENLRVAARMQKAAEELQALQRGANGPNGAARQADIGRKLAEVQALQRQLRVDFHAGQPPTSARP